MKKLLFALLFAVAFLLVSCESQTTPPPSQEPPVEQPGASPTAPVEKPSDERPSSTPSHPSVDPEKDPSEEPPSTKPEQPSAPTTPSAPSTPSEGEEGNDPDDGKEDSKTYSIRWMDETGKLLAITSVKHGQTPSYTYVVTDTAQEDRTFVGWTLQNGQLLSTIPSATSDATYYAKVTSTTRRYTVRFDTKGGTAVSPLTVAYGTVISAPQTSTYDGFRFVGWCQDANGKTPVDWSAPVTKDTTYYAIWNAKIDMGAYLKVLLQGYNMSPYSYIPETMRPGYAGTVKEPQDIINDYSSGVSVSQMAAQGYGEQWNMIVENLEQSQMFFNALSVVETLSSTSIAAFNNYLDKNPGDTAQHSFQSGIYQVSIRYDGQILWYVLDYTANFPLIGEQTAQISLSLDIASGERSVRVQLGDANALRYTVKDNEYDFAIKYLGVRRASFQVSKKANGRVEGHIYEYVTLSDAEIASAADFYIDQNYAVAVGNKADGMLAFTGCIAETYDVKTGKLLGYEVEESLSSLVYNTFFFDLCQIDGLYSIRMTEKTDKEDAKIYINGSSAEWKTKNVGSGLKYFSRRFYIEYRTQYFYTYDAQKDAFVQVKAQVPMLAVQEENVKTLTSDVKATNHIDISLGLTNAVFRAIGDHYDEKLPVFKENKGKITPADIVDKIGEKVVF